MSMTQPCFSAGEITSLNSSVPHHFTSYACFADNQVEQTGVCEKGVCRKCCKNTYFQQGLYKTPMVSTFYFLFMVLR